MIADSLHSAPHHCQEEDGLDTKVEIILAAAILSLIVLLFTWSVASPPSLIFIINFNKTFLQTPQTVRVYISSLRLMTSWRDKEEQERECLNCDVSLISLLHDIFPIYRVLRSEKTSPGRQRLQARDRATRLRISWTLKV